jgi:hypothetical protein
MPGAAAVTIAVRRLRSSLQVRLRSSLQVMSARNGGVPPAAGTYAIGWPVTALAGTVAGVSRRRGGSGQ